MRIFLPSLLILCVEFSALASARAQDTLIARNISELNTPDEDVYPLLMPDGKFYFSVGDSRGYSHIFSSKRNERGTFGPADTLPVLVNGAVAAITFDTLGNTFFSGNTDGLTFFDFDIWRSNASGVQRAPFRTKQWESQPSITLDGKDLYFARESPNDGNYRPIQIYVARQLTTGTWSEPDNLGQTINFGTSSATPFIADDGKTLFFSAERNRNYAIYMSTKDSNGVWSQPLLLPPPINMLSDSFQRNGNSFSPSLSRDHQYLYFSSNRDGGKGGYDLYEVKLPHGLESLYRRITQRW